MKNTKQKDCPKKGEVFCSEYAASGHNYRDCKSINKNCLNCGGPHRTMAMACPTKKQKMKEKEQEKQAAETKKQTETYSQIAKQATEIASKPTQISQVDSTIHLDIVAMVIHAHLHNIASGGGTYKTELNRLLADKGIGPINSPVNPPSNNLFNLQMNKQKKNTEKNPSEKPKRNRSEDETEENPQTQKQDNQQQQRERASSTSRKPSCAHELGIKITMENGATKKQYLDGETARVIFNSDKLKFELPIQLQIISRRVHELYIYKKRIFEKVEHIRWLEPAQYKQISSKIAQSNQDIQ